MSEGEGMSDWRYRMAWYRSGEPARNALRIGFIVFMVGGGPLWLGLKLKGWL